MEKVFPWDGLTARDTPQTDVKEPRLRSINGGDHQSAITASEVC